MNDTQVVLQAATIFLMVMVLAAILLMWDTKRSTKCKECPHCQRIVEDAERAQARAAHDQYHSWTTGVQGCEFCETRKE